jgi:cell division protein FtsB
MNDQLDILDEVEEILAPTQKMGVTYFLGVLILVILFLAAVFPKIYLQNQIYYKSREISKLKREYDALKEENRIIKAKVESIRFKNQILDTLF